MASIRKRRCRSRSHAHRSTSRHQVYDELSVMDGSVISGPIGVNPSLAISALVLRTAAYIQNKE
ncbi:MAG TPA: hypothetical protein VKA09_14660 [Nitrososphaeraceae archaeon]|nr:hypothetical protein [Nitrososphaeraceae archaeon]